MTSHVPSMGTTSLLGGGGGGSDVGQGEGSEASSNCTECLAEKARKELRRYREAWSDTQPRSPHLDATLQQTGLPSSIEREKEHHLVLREEERWKEVAETLQRTQAEESRRHEELLKRLDALISLQSTHQRQPQPQPQPQQYRVVSPPRSPVISSSPASSPAPRTRVTLPQQEPPPQKPRRGRRRRQRHTASPSHEGSLLRQISVMEKAAAALRDDTRQLERHNERLFLENDRYRQELKKTDTDMSHFKSVKGTLGTLKGLELRNQSVQASRDIAVGKLKASVAKLHRGWNC